MGAMRLPAADGELVQIVDAALVGAKERAGDWLVCHAGCTQCCYGAFAINALDAARLGEGMRLLRERDGAAAEAIEVRARAWIAEYGAEFPGDSETGRLGKSEEERERFEDFASEAACPALDVATGLCGVYEWRPMTCRVFGPPVRMEGEDGEGLGHCELCFSGTTAEQVAACEMPVPHELEAKVLAEIEAPFPGSAGETVVAWALVRPS